VLTPIDIELSISCVSVSGCVGNIFSSVFFNLPSRVQFQKEMSFL
jgi:hypothetical protein